MNKNTITDVFFDLDHTLWDFDRNSALALKRVFSKNEITLSLEDFLKVYEPINFKLWEQFREERVTKQELRRGRLIDSFKVFDIEFSTDKIDKMSNDYIDELPGNNYLLPGTLDLLAYLQPKYKLHIITNGFHEVQHVKLKKSNIMQFFNTVTSSEEVGLKKPNPKVFNNALNKASVNASQSIMIGDTYAADIIGAREVGMHTIFYNYRKESRASENFIVNHLSEIKDIL